MSQVQAGSPAASPARRSAQLTCSHLAYCRGACVAQGAEVHIGHPQGHLLALASPQSVAQVAGSMINMTDFGVQGQGRSDMLGGLRLSGPVTEPGCALTPHRHLQTLHHNPFGAIPKFPGAQRPTRVGVLRLHLFAHGHTQLQQPGGFTLTAHEQVDSRDAHRPLTELRGPHALT